MTAADYARKLDELDRQLNDPYTPLEPMLIWRLLDEVATHEADTRLLTLSDYTSDHCPNHVWTSEFENCLENPNFATEPKRT